jgi:arylsulfatase A-like enzyme
MLLSALFLAVLAPQELTLDAPRGTDRPSIVLVTIDTLRRDSLGCYGYPRPTSPRVDALAKESVLFENALAPMATTFPSHLSMLTGL